MNTSFRTVILSMQLIVKLTCLTSRLFDDIFKHPKLLYPKLISLYVQLVTILTRDCTNCSLILRPKPPPLQIALVTACLSHFLPVTSGCKSKNHAIHVLSHWLTLESNFVTTFPYPFQMKRLSSW